MRLTRRATLLAPFAVGGCSLLDDWFGDRKTPLKGRREAVIATQRGLEVNPAENRTIAVPAPAQMAEWPQPGGTPTHVVGNVAVSGFTRAWRSSIGDGAGYRRKITAQPVVAGGQVFAMDSDGQVSAFDVASGSRHWRTDTQSDEDRSTNLGGGIAVAGGTVYATTGRAELLALDAATGAIKWRKPVGAPARSGPTVVEGKLCFTTLDDRLLSFNAADGAQIWAYQAAASSTTVLTAAAPAVAEGFVVAGFGSGELAAVRLDSGVLAWSDSLASARGRNSLLDLSAVRGLPVIDRGRVFAIGVGGLFVSLDLRSGRRLWEREVGGGQTPWLAGDWLFTQTLDQTLAAINAEDGRIRWVRELPRWENPEKRRDAIFWSGPTMAANRLILASTNEKALSVDPVSGQILGEIDLSGSVSIAPVAAAGTLFILTDDGSLQAFR